MLSYKNRIKKIVDGVRPQFETLGMFAFQGAGDPEKVTKCFVDAFEAYQKAMDLTIETFGDDDIDMMAYMQMDAVYSIAKAQGFLPPPMLQQIGQFTMMMNGFFIEAQRR